MKKKICRKGFTLIEIIVSLFLISTTFLAFSPILIKAINISVLNEEKIEGINGAISVIEILSNKGLGNKILYDYSLNSTILLKEVDLMYDKYEELYDLIENYDSNLKNIDKKYSCKIKIQPQSIKVDNTPMLLNEKKMLSVTVLINKGKEVITKQVRALAI